LPESGAAKARSVEPVYTTKPQAMPTRFTRRQLPMVGASALGASAIAAPPSAWPREGAAAGREVMRAFPAGFLWGTATAAYQIRRVETPLGFKVVQITNAYRVHEPASGLGLLASVLFAS